LSITTKIVCQACDCFDLLGAVKSGELTVSIDDQLLLLNQDSNNYNIVVVVEADIDPINIKPSGTLYWNKQSGYLFFSDGTTNYNVGKIQQREGVNVISRSISSPPASPIIGDQYIIPGNSLWGSKPNYIARFSSMGWLYIVPSINQRCGIKDESADYIFNGYGWIKDTNSVWLEAISASDV
jgi:hypothetical protein